MYYYDEKIEVRYAETDQMGVVYHANYLVWMEIGRTAFIRSIGYKYSDMEAAGVISPVANVRMSYKHPAKYGETVTIRTWVKKSSQFRTTYGAEVYNEEGVLCFESECDATCVDKETFKLVSFKKKFPEWYAKYQEVATNELDKK